MQLVWILLSITVLSINKYIHNNFFYKKLIFFFTKDAKICLD